MTTTIESTFTLAGVDFDPADLTRRLGILPTRTWRLGEHVGGSRIQMKFDGWMISSGRSVSLDLGTQVRSLLDQLCEVKVKITEAQRDLHLTAEVSCILYVEGETPSMHFDSEVLSAIRDLQASLDFDLYVFIPEEEAG